MAGCRPDECHSHGSCGSRWHGRRTAHCARCCRTFSSITAFDRHWKGGHRSPLEAGLVARDGHHGTIWALAGHNPWKEEL